jgi:hypothetical protein
MCANTSATSEAASFVISLNLHCRHLRESLHAAVATKLANIAPDAFALNQHEPAAN